MNKKIIILGSTGSIGTSTLNVIKNDKKSFDVILLTANNNYKKLVQQAKFFKAKNMFEITRDNWLYTILYIFSFVISLIDIASGKVAKTHIEFERNIKNKKIEIYNLN